MNVINKYVIGFILMPLFLCTGYAVANSVSSYPLLEKKIKQKQYTKAYKQAIEIRSENEGDPRFDYLYGLSALESGHYNEAVFALDRVTVNTPRVIRPRLELARAYLKLNNRAAAVKEFNDVLNLSPPAIVRKKVEAYLVELKGNKPFTAVSLIKRLATFSLGYDNNINFGFDGDEIDLPGFGTLSLDKDSTKQGSGFAETGLQVKKRTIKSKTSSTFALVGLRHRDYFKNNDFNISELDLRTGILFNKNKRQYQFILRDRPIFLGGKLYTNTIGLDAIARQSLGAGKIASLSLSVENYDHKDVPLADRKRALVATKLDLLKGSVNQQFSAYYGKESPDESEGRQFSRDISGLAYRATQSWNSKHKSSVSLDYRKYQHQAPYPISPDQRDDNRLVFYAGHEWQIQKRTAVLLSLRHINNSSNLDLYDAKRNEIKVGVRYEWD